MPSELQHLTGGLFALGAGACWAGASILFSKLQGVPPLAMNFAKGLVGLACLGLALLFTGLPNASLHAWLLLGASGLVGISLGDTAFFHTLKRLGPRRTLLMTTLIPVLVALLSFLLLGERLSALGWLGAALCVFGVSWTMWERLPADADRGSWRAGIGWGMVTVASCAAAVILSKLGVERTQPLQATFIRLLCGTAGLLILGLGMRSLGAWLKPLRAPRAAATLAAAAFVGTFLGIWLSLASLAYTTATISTVLGATDPVFVLPLAAFFLGEKVSLRAVLGAFTALGGVGLLLTC